jgi:hypothetical protein
LAGMEVAESRTKGIHGRHAGGAGVPGGTGAAGPTAATARPHSGQRPALPRKS